MKTLILPDIHNNWFNAEEVIDKENPNKIIFLGDYFDSFDDGSTEKCEQTAQWLKESLKKSKRVHLIGNHDLAYATNGEFLCSGWNGAKQFVINNIVKIPWKKIKYFAWQEGWLFTHAGLTDKFFKAYSEHGETPREFLSRYSIDKDLKKTLWACSNMRGGQDLFSGIFWCDLEEFENIKFTKQMFGHSARDTPTYVKESEKNQWYCIDTYGKYYAILEDGKMRVEKK